MRTTLLRCIVQPTSLLRLAAFLVMFSVASSAGAQSGSLTITRVSDLDFGDVTPSPTYQVLTTDAGASVFRLEAAGMTGVQNIALTFTLPGQIANGADTIPITFGAAYAAWSYTNNPGTATSFDPDTGVTIAKNGNPTVIYLWIGGSISPDLATPTQSYAGSLTLDAQFQ